MYLLMDLRMPAATDWRMGEGPLSFGFDAPICRLCRTHGSRQIIARATNPPLAVLWGVTTDDKDQWETQMNTLYTKLSAFAAAIAMNGLIMTGVLYLFSLQAQAHLYVIV